MTLFISYSSTHSLIPNCSLLAYLPPASLEPSPYQLSVLIILKCLTLTFTFTFAVSSIHPPTN